MICGILEDECLNAIEQRTKKKLPNCLGSFFNDLFKYY